MKPGRKTIREHPGSVLVENRMLFEGLEIYAADQVLPKTEREAPTEGRARITKAAAYRMLDKGIEISIREAGGAFLIMHEGPNAGATPEGIPALVRQWRKFQPIKSSRRNDKPTVCTQDCGELLPDPPAELPWAKMPFECGLGKFGTCPVRKSINRRRKEALRYWLDLWKPFRPSVPEPPGSADGHHGGPRLGMDQHTGSHCQVFRRSPSGHTVVRRTEGKSEPPRSVGYLHDADPGGRAEVKTNQGRNYYASATPAERRNSRAGKTSYRTARDHSGQIKKSGARRLRPFFHPSPSCPGTAARGR